MLPPLGLADLLSGQPSTATTGMLPYSFTLSTTTSSHTRGPAANRRTTDDMARPLQTNLDARGALSQEGSGPLMRGAISTVQQRHAPSGMAAHASSRNASNAASEISLTPLTRTAVRIGRQSPGGSGMPSHSVRASSSRRRSAKALRSALFSCIMAAAERPCATAVRMANRLVRPEASPKFRDAGTG